MKIQFTFNKMKESLVLLTLMIVSVALNAQTPIGNSPASVNYTGGAGAGATWTKDGNLPPSAAGSKAILGFKSKTPVYFVTDSVIRMVMSGVNGNFSMGNTVDTTSAKLAIDGSLKVNGHAILNTSKRTGDDTVAGNSTILGNSEVFGTSIMWADLNVIGPTVLSSQLDVSGQANFFNGIVVSNAGSAFNAEVLIDSLDVTKGVNIGGHTNMSSARRSGNDTVGGTFDVTGNSNLSTVMTSGLATLNSMSVTNNATIGGTATITTVGSGSAGDSLMTINGTGLVNKRTVNDVLMTAGTDLSRDTWTTIAGVTSSATDVIINGITVGRGGSNGTLNTAFGIFALQSNTTGSDNSANGTYSLHYNTTGSYNTANGVSSLINNTTGNYNTADGNESLFNNTTGNENVANGPYSMHANTTGSYNTANGMQSLYSNVTGSNNTSDGYQSLFSNIGKNNAALGSGAGYANTTGDSSVFLGNDAGRNATTSKRLYIANNASSTLIYGEFDTARVGINTTSPKATLHVAGTARITGLTSGTAADSIVTTDASGNLNMRTVASVLSGLDATADTWSTVAGITSSATDVKVNGITVGKGGSNVLSNTAFGINALVANTTGYTNTAIGQNALSANTTGGANTAIGRRAGQANTTGNNNVFIGEDAGLTNTTGLTNVGVGMYALRLTNSDNNSALGFQSMMNTSTGTNNAAFGRSSLLNNTTGNENTVVGSNSGGGIVTGSNNTILGASISSLPAGLTGHTIIGNTGTGKRHIVGFDDGNIFLGAGTSLPTNTGEKLQINATADPLKLTGLSSGSAADSILTVNSTGVVKMRDVSSLLSGLDTTNDEWKTSGGSTSITSNVKVTGDHSVSGNDTVGGTLNVTGNTNLSTVMTSGLATLNSVSVTNNATIGGTATITSVGSGSAADSLLTIDGTGLINKRTVSEVLGSGGSDLSKDTWSTVAGVTSSATDVKVNGITVGKGGSNVLSNTAFGINALVANTTGYTNTAIGQNALSTNTTGGANTAIGRRAGQANTTGNNNVFVGEDAGLSNTTGLTNVGVGMYALRLTNSDNNSALGFQSMMNTSTGTNNAAFGRSSLLNNTTGNENTVVGSNSGGGIVTGSNNTIIGASISSLPAGLTGHTIIGNTGTGKRHIVGFDDGNIFLGASTTLPTNTGEKLQVSAAADPLKLIGLTAGSPSDSILTVSNTGVVKMRNSSSLLSGADLTTDAWVTAGVATTISTDVKVNGITVGKGGSSVLSNTAIGVNALTSNTTGYTNTAVGQNTLLSNTTGGANTAIGRRAGQANTTGNNNVFIGEDAGLSNTTGLTNVAVGMYALRLTNSNDNSALGFQSMMNTTTGINNAAFGRAALLNNTTGSYNTVLGTNAGGGLITGSYNTVIGAAISSLPAGLTGHTIIGNTGTGKRHFVGFDDGNVFIGAGTSMPTNTGEKLKVDNGTTQGTYTTTGWAHSSDARLKDNVQPLENSMELISKLKGVSYNWKNNKEAGRQLGFIAQDVKKIVPEVVVGKEGDLEKGETLGMVYQNLVPVLVEAMKELKKENDNLKERLEKLENRNSNPTTNAKEEVKEIQTEPIVLDMDILYQNVPNPASDVTVISYNLAKEYKNPFISVFSSDGKLIESISLLAKKGIGSIKLSLGKLNNGVYIYNLIADEKILDTKKLELIK